MSNKIPGPPVGYTDLLDYELVESKKVEEAAYKEGTKERYFPLRPSSAGYCAKRLAQDLMHHYGYEEHQREPSPPALQRLFRLGGAIEYATLSMFNLVKLVRVTFKQQVVTCFKLSDGTLLRGSLDNCLINKKWKCIMDVKSTKDKFSVRFKTRWDEVLDKFDGMESLQKLSETAWFADDIKAFMAEHGDDFLFDNILQLNLYACSDFMKETGIDHCVIYKYNKNDSRHYELRFRPDQSLTDEVQAKFNLVIEAVAKKDISGVKSTCKLGTMRAAFCPCRSDGDAAKKAWYATLPKKKWPVKLPTTKLKTSFKEYEELLIHSERKDEVVLDIVNDLVDRKIHKVELDNGNVYEVKYLKSLKPPYQLRPSKK